jgi:integrase/recombinase XerC
MATTRKTAIHSAKGIIETFLDSHKPVTSNTYAKDLEHFRAWINTARGDAETIPEAIADLLRMGSGRAHEIAKHYKAHLRNNYAASTVNRRLACLRSLTRTVRDLQKTTWRLRIANLKTAVCRDTRGPGRDAIVLMLEIARLQGGQKGPRDIAMIHLLYGMGLRVGELVAINFENLHIDGMPAGLEYIDIWGKGKNEFQPITMPYSAYRAVSGWVVYRGKHPGPLFTNMSRAHDRTKRITTSGARKMIATIGNAAGVKTTPHGLRHTAITDAITMLGPEGSRMSLLEVQAFSRHANVNTLQVYFDRDAGVAAEVARMITAGL